MQHWTYKCETCAGDYFTQRELFISDHEAEGDFLIAGDLNARTGLELDFIEPEMFSFTEIHDTFCDALNYINFPSNITDHILPRCSKDKHAAVNVYG